MLVTFLPDHFNTLFTSVEFYEEKTVNSNTCSNESVLSKTGIRNFVL